MLSELYRVNIKQDHLTVPKHLPNNLKKIKALYKITDKELAERLDIEPSYISSVSNSRATFSGGITIKLLQELGIEFSFFADINEDIRTNCYEYEDALIVISSDVDLKTVSIEEINKIANSYVKVYDDTSKDTLITVINFSQLEECYSKNSSYQINVDKNFYAKIGKERLNNYNNLLVNVPVLEDKIKFVYAIGAEIRKCKEQSINIDTLSSLNTDMCNIINKIPFKKVLTVSIPKEEYSTVGKNVKLKNKYNILTKSGVKSVNILKNGQYTSLVNNSIIFYAFTDEDIWNKLKVYRLLNDYSSEYMATLLGIRKESYRLLEVGHNKLTTHQMWKIENKLGILLESMVNLDKYTYKFNS